MGMKKNGQMLFQVAMGEPLFFGDIKENGME